MARILRKSLFPKSSVLVGQKSILRHYSIQYVTERVQIPVYKSNKERVTDFRQLISVKLGKCKTISSSISGKVKKIEA